MATSATGVVERVRLEVETLRRESLHWHLHPLPEITLQALIKSSGGLVIIVDLLPSPELELPEDPTTIELIVGPKYGVNPPVVRCCGTFLHALCDPSTRQMDLPMLKRAERGWSKSYSLSAVLHALRRSFLRRGSDSSLNLWVRRNPHRRAERCVCKQELRSKHLQHLETKYHIDSPQVVVGQCRSAGAASVGARDVMEDAYVCVEQLQCDSASMLGFHPAVYCIADGHAGSECANFLVRTLPSAIGAHLARDKSPRESLWRAFTDVDLDFTKWAVARNDTSVELLNSMTWQNPVDPAALAFASSLTASTSSTAPMSAIPGKATRLTFGQLTVTRTFGDVDIKKHFGDAISAAPEISEWSLSPTGDVVVVASDGLYAALDNRSVAGIVMTMLAKGEHLQAIASELIRVCIKERCGEDNTSVIVLQLTPENANAMTPTSSIQEDLEDETPVLLRSTPMTRSVDKLLADLAIHDVVGGGATTSSTTTIPQPQDGLDGSTKRKEKQSAVRRPLVTSETIKSDDELMQFLLDEENFNG
ncbi:hypothetical protein LEN26_012525 [Aphanomyces euteiches]|nr:hypothetical protein LEN26_012525 [Aphanomyces euteiches]